MTNLVSILKSRDNTANQGPYSQSYSFSIVVMDLRVGPQRKLRTDELMLSNCGAREDF